MRRGVEDFWTAAREIRDDRLWRAAADADGHALYTSWSDFLEKEFGCAETTGNRLITHADTAAKIRDALRDTPIGVLPEGMTREIPAAATAEQAGTTLLIVRINTAQIYPVKSFIIWILCERKRPHRQLMGHVA
jgi:hypothetical protein